MGILSRALREEPRTNNTEFHPTDELIAIEHVRVEMDTAVSDIDTISKVESIVAKKQETEVVVKENAMPLETLEVAKEGYTLALEAVVGDAREAEYIISAEADNILQQAWEAFKKAIKKAWTYIVEMVTRLINFIKGIFGKKETTADELEKMLKKLKEQGKTVLKAEKFEEIVASRLVKEVKIIAYAFDTKLSGNDYIRFLEEQKKVIEEDELGWARVSDVIGNIIKKASVGKAAGKYIVNKNMDSNIKEIVEEKSTILDTDGIAIVLVAGLTPREIKVIGLAADKDDLPEGRDRESIKTIGDVLRYRTETISISDDEVEDLAKNIVPLSFAECENVVEAMKKNYKAVKNTVENLKKNLDNDKKVVEEIIEQLAKLPELYKETKEALEEFMKKISVDSYEAGVEMLNATITLYKGIAAKGGDVELIIKTHKETLEKLIANKGNHEVIKSALINFNKKLGVKNPNNINFAVRMLKIYPDVLKKILNHYTSFTSGVSSGATTTATSIFRSPIQHVIKESARLFEKA